MPRQQTKAIDRDAAEAMALNALAFLAADAQRLGRFLALTGIGPAELRAAAATSGLQAATLDYLLSDESLLLLFCHDQGIEPESVAPAQAILAKHA